MTYAISIIEAWRVPVYFSKAKLVISVAITRLVDH